MGIRSKLLLTLLLGFSLAVVVLHLYLAPDWLRHERDTFLLQQRDLLVALEPDIIRHVLSSDYAALYSTIDEQLQRREKTWRQLVLELAQGERLYPISDPVPFDTSSQHIESSDYSIELGGRQLVKIRLVTDWTLHSEEAGARIRNLELTLLSIFGLMCIIGLAWLSVFVRRPLARLEYAAERLAHGDFNVELPPSRNDEIGRLTRAFFTMRTNLLQSQNDLQQAAHEAQVAERLLQSKQSDLIDEHKKVNQVLEQIEDKNKQLEQAHKKLAQSHQQALQSEKMASVGQLAAGIAHEINTPIQYVGDNTRFLQDAFEDLMRLVEVYETMCTAANEDKISAEQAKKVHTLFEEIEVDFLEEEVPKAISQSLEGVERVSRIVLSMKEFSHPGSDRKEVVDINKAIESTLTVSRNEWKYNAEMVTSFDEVLTAVPCYLGEFNQAILNMIVNASHAIADCRDGDNGELGTITIDTRLDDGYAEVRISDTGTGMPEEVRKRIFEPFYTTKEVGKGSGQGLAIAYSVIVDKHSGTIEVDSVPGKGTTFVIRLPMSDSIADTVADNNQDRNLDDEEAYSVC